jgi:hypothetical protein
MTVVIYVLIGGLVGFVISMLYGLTTPNSILRRNGDLKPQFHPEFILQLLAVPLDYLYWKYPEMWLMNWVIVAGIGMLIGYMVFAVTTYL